jgi:hypothetical protein
MGELALSLSTTTAFVPGDVLVVLYIASPFVMLGGLAWSQRANRGAAWGLLAVALGVAALGLFFFGTDFYHYHTDPEYRRVQRMTAFITPILQGMLVLAAGLVLLARRLVERYRRAA